MANLLLDIKPIGQLADDRFFDLCQANRDLSIERTAQGKLLILSPTGGESSNRNSEVTYQTHAWSRTDESGLTFDSSTGFTLPNWATYAPDVSWVRRDRGLSYFFNPGLLEFAGWRHFEPVAWPGVRIVAPERHW